MTGILPILPMRKLSLSVGQWLAESHTASKHDSQKQASCLMLPKATVIPLSFRTAQQLSSTGSCLTQMLSSAMILPLLPFTMEKEARLLNLGFANDCTFIPTERQKYILGNYSLIIPQVSTLMPRDKNKMYDWLNMLKVILNTCEGIWWTKVFCYQHVRVSLINILHFHILVFRYTWLLLWFFPSPCLQI